MDETHRFLRYVVPGLSFFVEAALLLLLLLPEWTAAAFFRLAKAELAAVLLAFMGSGGFGFLFSTVHHVFRETRFLGGADHRRVIARLRNRNILQLFNAFTGDPLPDAAEPDRREAWNIVNALWHQRVSPNSRIGNANERAQSLADIVHSTGSARVGAVFAAIFAFAVASVVAERSSETSDIVRFVGAVLLAVTFVLVHHRAYWQTSRTAEHVVAEVLDDALTASCVESWVPVRTYVAIQRPG